MLNLNSRVFLFICLSICFFSSCAKEKSSSTPKENQDLDAVQLVQRAQTRLTEGKTELAIEDYKNAIRLDSLNPALRHALADTQLDYLRSREALSTLEKAAKDFPDNRLTMMKLSEFQLLLRQYGASKKTLEGVLEKYPQYDEAYFMLGLNAYEQKMQDRAISFFQRATELNADNLDAWLMLGTIYSEMDNPMALKCYDNAISINSQSWEAYHEKAYYLQNHGDIPTAKMIYRDIISQNPQYEDALFNLGILLEEQDSLKAALHHFELTSRVNPQYAMAYYYQGKVYEEWENYSKAKEAYEQALRLVPSFKRAQAALDFVEAKM